MREDAHGRRAARLVELEAYVGPDDRASHARFGRTERNAVMWGVAGLAYVYLVYGMYDCLNVVTGPQGFPSAVLIRAAVPTEGIELMRSARLAVTVARRHLDPIQVAAEAERLRRLPPHRLAAGPGLLAAAFGIDRTWTGVDLCDPASPLRLEPRPVGTPPAPWTATPRIGIAYAGEPWLSRPWRFVTSDEPHPSAGATVRRGRADAGRRRP